MKSITIIIGATLLVLSAGVVLSAQTNSPPSSPQPSEQGIGLLWTFLIGAGGATCMYLYWFRTERIQKAIASFHTSKKGGNIVPIEKGWKTVVPEGRLLFFDFVISILLGGVAAMLFIATDGTWKEAFFFGCTWTSLLTRMAKSGERGKKWPRP